MTDLECRIREAIGEFCTDMCAEASSKALLGVLELHNGSNDGHRCIQRISGHGVPVWYDQGDDCPTVVAIGRGLFGEEENSDG